MTTFDKEGFLAIGDKPWLWLRAVADEFERLHAEIAALKAERLPTSDAEPWGWAVLDSDNNPFTNFGFCGRQLAIEDSVVHVLWFETEEDAGILSDALNLGHVAKVNQKTLEKI